MKCIEVTQDFVDRIHKARMDRWNRMPLRKQLTFQCYGKKRSGFPGFYPICEGCHKILVPGDQVLEFRSYRFCHNSISCINLLHKSSLTQELRNLVKAVYLVE